MKPKSLIYNTKQHDEHPRTTFSFGCLSPALWVCLLHWVRYLFREHKFVQKAICRQLASPRNTYDGLLPTNFFLVGNEDNKVDVM